jgi:hypothetical protein
VNPACGFAKPLAELAGLALIQEKIDLISAGVPKALEDLRGLMNNASTNRERDPVLIEYNQQNGG